MVNITYRTDQIARFYEANRIRWEQFYPSERFIFEHVAERFGPPRVVLDAGCAAGGLGLALKERFGTLESYTGVDINRQVIALAAQKAEPWQAFVHGDVATVDLPAEWFQWVVSLGCADWNLEPRVTIQSLWEKVSPNGLLILSLRLTELHGACDPTISYQRITFFDDDKQSELANYVVFNAAEAISLLSSLAPDVILGYGYWGSPSSTAVTPYKRLAFTVFAVHKLSAPHTHPTPSRTELNVPGDLLAGLRPAGI